MSRKVQLSHQKFWKIFHSFGSKLIHKFWVLNRWMYHSEKSRTPSARILLLSREIQKSPYKSHCFKNLEQVFGGVIKPLKVLVMLTTRNLESLADEIGVQRKSLASLDSDMYLKLKWNLSSQKFCKIL